jgi:hypothetical protein
MILKVRTKTYNIHRNKLKKYFIYKQVDKCLAWSIIIFVKYDQFRIKNLSLGKNVYCTKSIKS